MLSHYTFLKNPTETELEGGGGDLDAVARARLVRFFVRVPRFRVANLQLPPAFPFNHKRHAGAHRRAEGGKPCNWGLARGPTAKVQVKAPRPQRGLAC